MVILLVVAVVQSAVIWHLRRLAPACKDSLALVAHNWRKLHGADTITFLHNLLQFYIIHGTKVESDLVEHCIIPVLVLLLT